MGPLLHHPTCLISEAKTLFTLYKTKNKTPEKQYFSALVGALWNNGWRCRGHKQIM